jgi:phosphoenolpyruvate carboxylase
MSEGRSRVEKELDASVRQLGDLVGQALRRHAGEETFSLIEGLRRAAVDLRAGRLEGGREALAARLAALDLKQLEGVARAFTLLFHLINAAEEQHRIRTLRGRDRPDALPEGSIAAAVAELRHEGASAGEVRGLVERLFVMPVLTAHPTEAHPLRPADHRRDGKATEPLRGRPEPRSNRAAEAAAGRPARGGRAQPRSAFHHHQRHRRWTANR